MQVLVTGAGGFVGANLVRRLLRDGHAVHALVRPGSDLWRLRDVAGELCVREDGMERVVREVRPETVFHLAAHGAYPTQNDTERMVATNVTGTMALLDACAANGVAAYVQTGSSSEYGYRNAPARETDLPEPNSTYAITKAAATHYAQLVARTRDLHAVTLRLYSIYGPYEEPTRLVPTLIVRGMEGGLPPLVSPKTARDFVYVDDAVDAMVRTAELRDLPRGSVYNVCSGKQTTVEEVVAVTRGILPVKAEPEWSSMDRRQWDTSVWVGSPVAMEAATGWRATTGFRDGFARTSRWITEDPERLDFYRTAINARSRPAGT